MPSGSTHRRSNDWIASLETATNETTESIFHQGCITLPIIVVWLSYEVTMRIGSLIQSRYESISLQFSITNESIVILDCRENDSKPAQVI